VTSPFPLPLAFTSWAFNKTNGEPVDKDAAYNTAIAAAEMDAETIAVQIGQGITTDEVTALRQAGLFVVGWCECDTDTAYTAQQLGLDGFMPQIEGAGQYDAAVRTLRTLTGLLPVAVVSDYGGLDTKTRCDVLRSYGAETLFVEAYADSGAQHADLPHYVTELAANYGYDADHAVPVMGTYRNEHPTAYAGVDNYAGASFAVYLLEPMTDQQLDAFAELAAAPPPKPKPPANGGTAVTAPPTDIDCRATVRQAAKAWESQQASYQPRARLTVARRVCDDSNTNDKWTAIRDQIVALLDQQAIAK
jgi:hypothetical protein